MRTPKYRIWDSKLKKFRFSGFVDDITQIGVDGILSFDDKDGRYVFQQSTEIFDKNNEEIYEGDFVKATGWENTNAPLEVVFERGGYVFRNFNGMAGFEALGKWNFIHLEIVGNIYQEEKPKNVQIIDEEGHD